MIYFHSVNFNNRGHADMFFFLILLNMMVKYKFSLIKMFYDIIWQATSLKRYDLHG